MLKAGLANLQGHQNFVYILWPGADSQGKTDQDKPRILRREKIRLQGRAMRTIQRIMMRGGEKEGEEVDEDVPDLE